MTSTTSNVYVLGPMRLTSVEGEVPISTAMRRLLAVVVAAGRDGVSNERLADELWNDKLPASWNSSLRMAVSRLNHRAQLVVRVSGRYALNPNVGVDSWRLGAALQDSDWKPSLSDLVAVFGIPFEGMEITPLLEQAEVRILADQLSAIDRLLRAKSDKVGPVLPQLRMLASKFWGNEQLVSAVLRAHVSVEELDGAQELYELVAHRMSESGLEPNEEIIKLRSEVFSDRLVDLPPQLQMSREHHVVGRTTQLQRAIETLNAGAPVAVIASAGMGKTRFLAELGARRASLGRSVVYVAGSGTDVPYGAFMAANPELRHLIQEEISGAPSHELAQSKVLAAIADDLGGRSFRGSTLLVDNFDLLDSRSRSLVEFLQRASPTDEGFELAVAGRDVRTDSSLPPPIELGPLDELDVAELLRASHPDLESGATANLAPKLLAMSGGNPAVLSWLIRGADSQSLLDRAGAQLDWSSVGIRRYLVTELTADVIEVGVFAAVLGFEFQIGELVQLSGLDEQEVLDQVDELLRLGLLVGSATVDRFQFSHELVLQSLAQMASARKLQEVHAAAAGITPDVHRRARHLAAAVPLVTEIDAANELMRSAEKLAHDGLYLEVVETLRRAEQLVGNLPLDLRVLLVVSLEKGGGDARRMRREVFNQASRAADWGAALDIAAAGLPFGERPDGDADRISLLLRTPEAELPADRRFEHALACARQLRLAGHNVEANEWVVKAHELAATKVEVTKVWLLNQSLRITEQAELVTRPASFDESLFPQVFEADAMRTYESGSIDDVDRFCEQMREAAEAAGDPVRGWHSRVLAATVAHDRGWIESARELSQQAVAFGRRYGFRDSEATGLAQLFLLERSLGREAHLAPFFDAAAPDVTSSLLSQAAAAVAYGASGDFARGSDIARSVVTSALAHDGPHTVAVVGLLARLVGQIGDGPLAADCRRLLEQRSGSALLVGFGVGGLGPVDGLISELVDDVKVRQKLLSGAVAQADAARMTTWSVKYRIALADASEDEALLDEARQLAAETDLAVQ